MFARKIRIKQLTVKAAQHVVVKLGLCMSHQQTMAQGAVRFSRQPMQAVPQDKDSRMTWEGRTFLLGMCWAWGVQSRMIRRKPSEGTMGMIH